MQVGRPPEVVSKGHVSMLSEFPIPSEASPIWNNYAASDTVSSWRSTVTTSAMEDPMNSRIFVVCGKSIEVRIPAN